MKYEPFLYQIYTQTFIEDYETVGVFLDMGMGKTVVTLSAIKNLIYRDKLVKRVLVIAPLEPAVKTWLPEIAKWEHLKQLRVSSVIGDKDKRLEALKADADIYIINRENVAWLVDLFRDRWPFDMVVIDELSSFKSTNAIRFRQLRKVRKYIKRIVGLTGTPAANGLIDLWPQVYLLDEGVSLGRTVTSFRNEFFVPGRRNGHVVYEWIPKPDSKKRIYDALEPFCISMRDVDYLDLPERTFINRGVVVSQKEREAYEQLQRDTILFYDDGNVDGINSAVLGNKLLQLTSGAVYDDNKKTKEYGTAKLEGLKQLIEEANGQPVLVLYSYKHELERLKKLFPEARTIKEPTAVEDWNAGKISILFAHPKSAGHGLNLQYGGNVAIWFSLPWSLEEYQQANKRLHRPGQTKPVYIYHLIAENTIDEKVLQVLESKDATQNELLTALKAHIREVT